MAARPAASWAFAGHRRTIRRLNAGFSGAEFMVGVEEVLEATSGRLIRGDSQQRISGVSIDSRTLNAGDLFIAIKGDRFDGHDFLTLALDRGACGVMIDVARHRIPSPGEEGLWRGRLVIGVGDTLVALQQLAAYHRRRFKIPIAAITGSNGKTTTKEMAATIIARVLRLHRNTGNLNNHIGVPLTLLGLRPGHQAALLELGINRPGEMARLCEIARPGIGLITNIGASHLEGLGSVDGVAREKSELVAALPPDGVAILNGDDDPFSFLRGRAPCRVVSFGFGAACDVRIAAWRPQGERQTVQLELRYRDRGLIPPPRGAAVDGVAVIDVALSVPGRHNAMNAAAAAAVAAVLGVDPDAIRAGLAEFVPVAMRSQVMRWRDVAILFDAYNANPASMRAALTALGDWPRAGRRVAVLGDMLELGEASEAEHRALGRELARGAIDLLVTVGPQAALAADEARDRGLARAAITVCRDPEEAAAALKRITHGGDVVLIKGSRGMRLEKLLDGLGRVGAEGSV